MQSELARTVVYACGLAVMFLSAKTRLLAVGQHDKSIFVDAFVYSAHL